MNRALTVQNAFAIDARCMRVRPELRSLYDEIFGKPGSPRYFDWDKEPQELRRRSILFSRRIRELGYLIVWDPSFITGRWKANGRYEYQQDNTPDSGAQGG